MTTSISGEDDRAGTDAWYKAIAAEWEPIVEEMRRLGVPVRGLEQLGGGFIAVEVAAENPREFCWLGASAALDDEAPYVTSAGAEGRCFVGGYYYRISDPETGRGHQSARTMLPVDYPDDPASVATTMRDAWRMLKDSPCDQPI